MLTGTVKESWPNVFLGPVGASSTIIVGMGSRSAASAVGEGGSDSDWSGLRGPGERLSRFNIS